MCYNLIRGEYMSNNNMNFVQSDLLLRYVKSDKAICFDGIHNNNYVIVLCLGGRIKIEYSNRIYFMKSGDIFLADRREEYQIYYGGIESEFLEIRFQAKFFHNLDKEIDLLMPFYKKEALKIINMYSDENNYQSIIDHIFKELVNKKSRAFILSAVLELLCEINYSFENNDDFTPVVYDTNYTKIAKYVDSHLFEKITIASVAENVFLSPRCITNTVKRIRNMTFHDWITEKRLYEAKYLVAKDFHSLNEVAMLFGFETYSTFYRAFKEKFGISPSEYRKQQMQGK